MKNKTFKKALSLVLAVVMTLSVFSYVPMSVQAAPNKAAVTKTQTEEPATEPEVQAPVTEEPVVEQPVVEQEQPVVTTQVVEKTVVEAETVVDTAANTAAEQKVLQAQVDGLTFEVSGVFNAGTVLEVVQLETDVNEYIHNDILALPELPEGFKGLSYDIKLMENGVEIQPSADVTVTVKDAQTTAETKVFVYHMEGTSAEDIYSAYMADAGVQMLTANAAEEKVITGEEIENVTVGEGFYQFVANSFSVYYVVAGANSGDSRNDTTIREITSGTHTYYVEPGTVIAFTNGNWSGNGTSTITRSNRTITVSVNAQIGDTATFTTSTPNATLTFIVSDRNTIIDNAISTQPVYLSIKTDTGIPGEPGLSDGDYKRLNSNYQANGWMTWRGYIFANNASGIILPSIKDVLEPSIDGSSTLGAYDPAGSLAAYVSGVDMDRLMDVAIAQGARANGGPRNGQAITNAYRDQYKLIPYVIKYMTEKGVGWHIDFAVVPADDVTLSYNINLKNYVVTETLELPNAVTSVNSVDTTVAYVKYKGNNLGVDSKLTASLEGTEYQLTFKGWSTDPNANAAEYKPGENINVSQDTVLYAVWEGKVNQTVIRYEVVGGGTVSPRSETLGTNTGTAKGSTATANANYTFVGWFDNANCTGDPLTTDAKYAPTKPDDGWVSVTYYAKFVEQKAEINYVVAKGEGTVSTSSEQVDKVTGTATGSTATAGTNYVFEGWFDNAECTGTPVSANAAFVPVKTGDAWPDSTTYYAKFIEKKAVINYIAVGGGEVNPTSEQLNVVTGTASGSTATANPGYTFDGWYDAQGTQLSTATFYDPVKPTAGWVDGTTYYAKFVEEEVTINYHAVTQDAGGNKVVSADGGEVYITTETISKATGTAAGSTATAKAGYTFMGWFKDADCTTPATTVADNKLTPDKVNDLNADGDYYALFVENTVTIKYVPKTFDLNGNDISASFTGGGVDPTENTDIGIVIGTAGSTATAFPNYAFAGWYSDEACTNSVGTAAEFTPAKVDGLHVATTYYAKFVEKTTTINYLAVVEDYGKTAETKTAEVSAEWLDSVTEGTIGLVTGEVNGSTATAKTGYTFEGWYSDEACTTAAETVVGNKLTPAKAVGTQTYYAKFVEQSVTITYVAVGPEGAENFGSVAPTSETLGVVTGTAQGSTATPNAPTFKFVGWYDNEKCEGKALSADAKYVPAKDSDGKNVAATYYAKFEYNLTSLTITKSVAEGSANTYNETDSFIFNVYKVENDIEILYMRVALQAGESVTIPGLIVGDTYKVVEETAWSWRYNESSAPVTAQLVYDATLNNNATQNEANFVNKATGPLYWLDNESNKENLFN